MIRIPDGTVTLNMFGADPKAEELSLTNEFGIVYSVNIMHPMNAFSSMV